MSFNLVCLSFAFDNSWGCGILERIPLRWIAFSSHIRRSCYQHDLIVMLTLILWPILCFILKVLCFVCRSRIYFKLIFCIGKSFGSWFFFCKQMFSCSTIICWKELPFSIDWLLCLCQKSFGHICVGIYLDVLGFCSFKFLI